MRLKHIKFKVGDDVLAYVESVTTGEYTIHAPVAIEIDPTHGYIAKNWLALSDSSFTNIKARDVLFINNASENAENYYREYIEYSQRPDSDPLSDELEAFIESKHNIKH